METNEKQEDVLPNHCTNRSRKLTVFLSFPVLLGSISDEIQPSPMKSHAVS